MPVPDFHEFNDQIGDIATVGEFWRWAMSDLLGNRNRGILAEYIVGKLIGADLSHPRIEWTCYDLTYGKHRIEVKSSAYVQSWHTRGSKRYQLSFGIAPHSCWDAKKNTVSREKRRWADVYVFCVFPAESHHDTRDVLNLAEWRFFVATTPRINDHVSLKSKQIGIRTVRRICGSAVGYAELKHKIDSILT